MSATPASNAAYVRTQFLERIAHELRGPAGVTAGALDEIELALGPDAEKLKSLFLMARRGMHRVLRAADRLQRTAALEGGQAAFAMVPADVRPLAAGAAHDAEYIEARRGIVVTVSAATEPCVASVDAEWLQNAVGEAVGNAIRFAKTSVSVDTREVDREVRITIVDDGPGFLTEPALGRFEASASKRGLGLSLALVREVIASHGGRLEIALRSDLEKGHDGPPGARVVLIVPMRVPRESREEGTAG